LLGILKVPRPLFRGLSPQSLETPSSYSTRQ
jgi:hypothetical protein